MYSLVYDLVQTQPLIEETMVTKVQVQQLATSTGTLMLQSQSLYPGDSQSLHSQQLPNLPFDLITEILCRLPVKSLIKLKSVSKSWNTLISDPKFVKKHLRMSTLHPLLISSFMNYSKEISLMVYPLQSLFTNVTTEGSQINFPRRNNFYNIVGSCNGILCLTHQNMIVLCNPSIRKYKILPSFKKSCGTYTQYSFGYDHLTDNYKVVVVSCSYEFDSHNSCYLYKTQAMVHTLGTDSWRLINKFPSNPVCGPGKFVSGTINWLASNGLCAPWLIISLDLGKESCREILLPDFGRIEELAQLTLGVLRDCLCILSHQETFLDIWLMKEYGNKKSWTKLFSVSYMGVLSPFSLYIALYISEDDQVLLALLSNFKSQLIVYDSKNQTLKIPDIQKIYGSMVPEIYVESFISPCS